MNRREFLRSMGVGAGALGAGKISDVLIVQDSDRQKAFDALINFENVHAKDEINEELLGHQLALVDNLFKATYENFVSCDPIINSIQIVDRNGISFGANSNGTFSLNIEKPTNYIVSRFLLEQFCVLSYCLQTDGVSDASGGYMSFFGFQIILASTQGDKQNKYINSNQVVSAFLASKMDLTKGNDFALKQVLSSCGIDLKLFDSFEYLVESAGLEVADIARPFFMSSFPAFAGIVDRKLSVKNIGNGDGTGFKLFDLLEQDNIFAFNNLLSTANGFGGNVV